MRIVLGLSLSLTGVLAPIGRQIEDALRLFVADANAAGGVVVDGERATFALRCHDDRSDPGRCSVIYRELCGSPGTNIILGPFSSQLVEAAAPVAESAGRLFINHSGTADELYEKGHRMMVGLPTPASQYLDEFVRLLATLKFWRKRLAVVVEPNAFGRAVARGGESIVREKFARRGGVRIKVKWDRRFDAADQENFFELLRRKRVNALVSAGAYNHDVAVMRAVVASDLDIPVLACVAAGFARFRADLGDHVEGIVGMSQWEPGNQAIPEIGPDPREFAHRMRTQTRGGECDYVAAQAYAAAVLAAEVLKQVGTCDQAQMRAQFSKLRTGTLFGAFEIDPDTGRQVAHRMLSIQWQQGRKLTIQPPSHDDRGSLEFPSGWRLIAAGAEMLKLTGRRREGDDANGEDELD